MKKGRPGHVLHVLTDATLVQAQRAEIQRVTGTMGIRATAVDRWPVARSLEQVTVDKYREEQLDEIEQIKRRMAKYKINVPMKELADALLIPEGFNDEQKLEQIPEPGYGLLRNPFFKTKKKKKKKGKKKK